MKQDFLLDDFSRDDERSVAGTYWQYFTDSVMGGRSSHRIERTMRDGHPVLHLRGEVRLENNGGFIQAALPLREDGGDFDASQWEGIRLRVKGEGDGYALHVRTADMHIPRQYYRADLPVSEAWTDVLIPFDTFHARAGAGPFDTRALRRIGIVASGHAFHPDLLVARLSFYR